MDGSLKKSYKGHFESVNCCKYNPVLCEFYTGSKDRNIISIFKFFIEVFDLLSIYFGFFLVWSPEKHQPVNESRASIRSSSLPKNTYSILSNCGRGGFSSGPQTVNSSEVNLEETINKTNLIINNNRRLDDWSDDE